MIATEVAQIFGYFFLGKSNALVLTFNGLGYLLGNFFTNSSGRTGRYVPGFVCAWFTYMANFPVKGAAERAKMSLQVTQLGAES
jgi:hypothetical protein